MYIKKLYNAVLEKELLRSHRFHVFLIVAFCVIAYSNSFQVPFHFDDKFVIQKNPIVKNLKFFINPSKAKVYNGHFEYGALKRRYVSMLTFALNYRLHQMDVAGYHWVNLSIHVLNALLVYVLVVLTFKTPFLNSSALKEKANSIALFASLFFACHPIQTQAVTYIWQRVTSLSTTFYCLSLVMYIQARLTAIEGHTGFFHNFFWYYLMSVISAILAMNTKEIAFTLPVVITLYEFLFLDGTLKNRLLYLFPLLLTLLIIPISLLGIDRPIGELIGDVSKVARLQTSMPRRVYLFTQFAVIVTYIRLLFFPINQNLDYDYPIYHTFFTPTVFLSFLLLLSIFGFGVYMFFRSRTRSRTSRIVAFGIFWFFIAFSVESSIIPIIDVIFEHRLYLPSIGFSISFIVIVFLIIKKFPNHRLQKNGIIFLILMIFIFSLSTYRRNIKWQSKVSLWEDVVKKSPNKIRGHNNLGNAYDSKGLIDQAIAQYQKALNLKPYSNRPKFNYYYGEIHYNLASAYQHKGFADKALEHYNTALFLKPDNIDAYNNIGVIYFNKGSFDKAIEYYKKALRLEPNYVNAFFNLGEAYGAKGIIDNSIKYYLIFIKHRPDYAEAHYNIGMAYRKKGLLDKAQEHFDMFESLRENNG